MGLDGEPGVMGAPGVTGVMGVAGDVGEDEAREASRMASRMRRTERTTLSCTTARHERRSSLKVFGEFISWKFLSVVDLPDSLWPVGGGRDSLAGRSERDEQARKCRQFSVQWFTPLLAVPSSAPAHHSVLSPYTPHINESGK